MPVVLGSRQERTPLLMIDIHNAERSLAAVSADPHLDWTPARHAQLEERQIPEGIATRERGAKDAHLRHAGVAHPAMFHVAIPGPSA
jgi:hypothetical protein